MPSGTSSIASSSEEFHCPTCELTLVGSNEIEAAGLNCIHEDRQEREMEYDPEYAND